MGLGVYYAEVIFIKEPHNSIGNYWRAQDSRRPCECLQSADFLAVLTLLGVLTDSTQVLLRQSLPIACLLKSYRITYSSALKHGRTFKTPLGAWHISQTPTPETQTIDQ